MDIPHEITKSVFFIAADVKVKKLSQNVIERRYFGTGFIVSKAVGEHEFEYLITAKHVITDAKRDSHDGKVYIIINQKRTFDSSGPVQGGSIPIEVSNWYPIDWEEKNLPVEYDTSVDVAFTELPQPFEGIDYVSLPISLFLDASGVSGKSNWEAAIRYGLGTDVFVTGLFYFHSGRKRIQPVVRSGIISMLPQEKYPSARFGDIDAYLVELMSIGGLSGSPVFVYAEDVHQSPHRGYRSVNSFYLLGLIHGHWDEEGSRTDSAQEDRYNIAQADKMNTGMAIVVPSTNILQMINNEEITKKETEIQEALDKK